MKNAVNDKKTMTLSSIMDTVLLKMEGLKPARPNEAYAPERKAHQTRSQKAQAAK